MKEQIARIIFQVEQLGPAAGIVIWLLAGLVSYLLGTRIISPIIKRVTERTSWDWDDILIRNGFASTLSTLVTVVLLSATRPLLGDMGELANLFLARLLNLALILSCYLLLVQVLRTVYMSYDARENSRNLPVKTLTQAVTVVLSILTIILVIAQLTDKNPVHILSGLGALTAVLMLVFKDSILGLVAGVQLSVYDLVRKGDWIEMPSRGADGDVIDITLTTVRVQNWDKTITAIPAYDLVSSSFKNWRGMSESGGRRIKRAINIDMNTIRFINAAELEEMKSIKLLREYLAGKQCEIEAFNKGHFAEGELANLVNGRRLTNVGTFRAYCTAYLKAHPQIHANTPGLTFLIRQLDPGPSGLPLEIYVFVKDTRWVQYEGIQADIFDHLLAALPCFGLRAFQQPTGADFRNLAGGKQG